MEAALVTQLHNRLETCFELVAQVLQFFASLSVCLFVVNNHHRHFGGSLSKASKFILSFHFSFNKGGASLYQACETP